MVYVTDPNAEHYRAVAENVTVLDYVDHCLLVSSQTPLSLTVAPEVGQLVRALQVTPTSITDVTSTYETRAGAQQLLFVLAARGMLGWDFVPERGRSDWATQPPTRPETTPATRKESDQGPADWSRHEYRQTHPIQLADLAAGRRRPSSPVTVRTLIVGGCVAQFTIDAFVRCGTVHGLDIQVEERWPGSKGELRRAVEETNPDVVIIQFPGELFLSRLWDTVGCSDHKTVRYRVESLKRVVETRIRELKESITGNTLGIVHNFARPATPPHGRLEFRQSSSFRRIATELNEYLEELVAGEAGIYVADEEQLSVTNGSLDLFDDEHFPYGHHGGSVNPFDDTPHQRPNLAQALAEEYVALITIGKRLNTIKAIVVDLDDVLWPGVVADDGFEWLDTDSTTRWVHLGLHQALRILKERGILLASCSRGDLEATLAAWSKADHPLLLQPEDFVLHKINWLPKVQNVETICSELGFDPGATMFLDDHPAERAEVIRAFPHVRVPECPTHCYRRYLLSDPELEVAALTDEGRQRTETTQAVLEREEMRSSRNGSHDDFLRELDVKLTIGAVEDSELERASELLSRTTQFTTSGQQFSADDLQVRRRQGADVVLGRVQDSFANYGLTCATVIEEGIVLAAAASCRIIGLEVTQAFMANALMVTGYDVVGVVGVLHELSRNTPARTLFSSIGFERTGSDRFELVNPEETRASAAHSHVSVFRSE